MIIHKVGSGERLEDIAAGYSVNPKFISEINGITPKHELCEGEELLIAMPTRTYTVKSGDTLLSIARRFKVKRQELLALNPSLGGNDGLCVGEELAIKYERQCLGMTAANGYISAGCSKAALLRALPYLVYVTFAIGCYESGSLSLKTDYKSTVDTVKSLGKIPLLRVYDKTLGAFLSSLKEREELTENMIRAAEKGGFSGIVFAPSCKERNSEYAEFIFEARKKMIGSELILLIECDCTARCECTDAADGVILICSDIEDSEAQSFTESVKLRLSEYAEHHESSKTFVDLLAHGYGGGGYLPLARLRELSRGCKIKSTPESLISEFSRGSELYRFESLSRIKAKLALVGELGFMGINIDIANVPISHLMAYHLMFSPVCKCGYYSDI